MRITLPKIHSLLLLAAVALPLACVDKTGRRSAATVDCDTISYDARNLSGKLEANQYATAEFATGKQAIREIDASAERFLARWQTVCKDYRNGGISQEEYRDESARMRHKMEELDELALRLEKAPDAATFQSALKEAHQLVVPEDQRSNLGIQLAIWAQRPDESQPSIAPAGATLGTGSTVYVELALAAPAHVYFYQVDANGKTTVIFPDARMGLSNPLPAGSVRVPPNPGVFTLNDKDLGIEVLHVVAANAPIPELEGAMSGGGEVSTAKVQCATRGLEYRPAGCPGKSRGLEFLPDAGSEYSMRAEPQAADDRVEVTYAFHHVGAHEVYGVKGRGVEMLDGAASSRPKNLESDFPSCPGGAEVKQMPAAGGSWEKWCIETNSAGTVVDHGPYRKWYASGKVWVTGEFDMGRRTGLWKTLDETGSVIAEVDYR